MHQRQNEDPKLWFRTERIFRVNGYWFFHTREDIDVGPYRTEFEATIESELLKNALRDTPAAAASQKIMEFMFESRTVADQQTHLGVGALTDYVVRESSTNLTIDALLASGE